MKNFKIRKKFLVVAISLLMAVTLVSLLVGGVKAINYGDFSFFEANHGSYPITYGTPDYITVDVSTYGGYGEVDGQWGIPVTGGDVVEFGMTIRTSAYTGSGDPNPGARPSCDLYIPSPEEGYSGIATASPTEQLLSTLVPKLDVYYTSGGCKVPPNSGWVTVSFTFTVPSTPVQYITTNRNLASYGCTWVGGAPEGTSVWRLATPVQCNSFIMAMWSPDTGFSADFKDTFVYINGSPAPSATPIPTNSPTITPPPENPTATPQVNQPTVGALNLQAIVILIAIVSLIVLMCTLMVSAIKNHNTANLVGAITCFMMVVVIVYIMMETGLL